MCGKHLCQSRLSAAYISSNRYMHIILFYFRLFILFSPGLPFTLTSLVLHPAFLRSSFVLPSSFIRPCPAFLHLSSPFIRPSFSLSTVLSLLPLRHSSSRPRHSRLDRESLSFPLFSPLSFQLDSPHLFQCSPSPPFPLLPPSFAALVTVIPGSTGNPLPSGASPPCHPERQRRIFPHGFLHNN